MTPIIAGLIRHALTTAGGALVANGALSTDEVDLAVGALITIIGVIWSALSKKVDA